MSSFKQPPRGPIDSGSFSSMSTADIMAWLTGIEPIREIDPRMKTARTTQEQHGIASRNLRIALWDMQRFDYLFPGKKISKTQNFKIHRLDSWPKWKEPHPELLHRTATGLLQLDAGKDAERLKSYVMSAFHFLAFTRDQMAQDHVANPPEIRLENWTGVKKMMCDASLYITVKGGRLTPFVTHFNQDSRLLMEIIDVKQTSWPEPSPKLVRQLQQSQEDRYGAKPGAPLFPMMESPKVPLIVVRYAYTEGSPAEGSSEFMLHLESLLRDTLPANASKADVRAALQERIMAGEETPTAIRMFARLLSHNSEFVDKDWADKQQSKCNAKVQKETKISFFVHCSRPRFRAVEEIETGKMLTHAKCEQCHKIAEKNCASFRAVHYCDASCARANWQNHKTVCQISKGITSNPSSLPPNTLYVPVRAYIHWVVDFGFACEQECVKIGGPPVDENPRNEYGSERFICRALLPANSEHGVGTAFVYDRRRSVMIRVGPLVPVSALHHGVVIPFHEKGYHQFAELVRRRGRQGQVLYIWGRRVGDCIEFDLKDIPGQRDYRWD
ncbi:hypothetical protein FB45DRAFT_160611 [Roridomyces roridus]|uniref:MYND-type domain-containing protein n=1 Tax=Roridomyces roridus TaxID=1738132 RepID=A0AAD7BFI5_9AGAR|nr:hypothetical protein FB45DRAFT_160611 [Roridomyces roridus]